MMLSISQQVQRTYFKRELLIYHKKSHRRKRHRMKKMGISVLAVTILAFIVHANGQCGRSQVQQSRIIAGNDAKPGAWPWMASLWSLFKGHICGGALLNPRWILTASHCVKGYNPNYLMIKIGEHDHSKHDVKNEQVLSVKRIILHPQYTRSPIKHDIALVQLATPARLTPRVQPICLPKAGTRPPIGSRHCYLSGWGSIRHPGPANDVLQQAMLPVVSKRNCFNNPYFICSGYGKESKTNACKGDSGGPFVCRRKDGSWEQHGVTSFVVEYCKYYTAFTPVGDYIPWINQYINKRIN